MHRHGYKGRKFHRERDQREALIKSLAEALIIHEKIETTIFKAKDLVSYVEKLVTKSKENTLHSRRQVISNLQTIASAHKLVDEIAPKLKSRNSGYLRIERTKLRRGDNAQLASVSFIYDEVKVKPAKVVTEEKKPVETKAKAKVVTETKAVKAPAKAKAAAKTKEEK